jgi:hypothetical protein
MQHSDVAAQNKCGRREGSYALAAWRFNESVTIIFCAGDGGMTNWGEVASFH